MHVYLSVEQVVVQPALERGCSLSRHVAALRPVEQVWVVASSPPERAVWHVCGHTRLQGWQARWCSHRRGLFGMYVTLHVSRYVWQPAVTEGLLHTACTPARRAGLVW
jgi:hypothetical protein